MVELGQLALLALNVCINFVFNGMLDCTDDTISEWSESLATVLSDHTEAVDGCLSDGSVLRVGVLADLLNNLGVDCS